MSKLNDNKVLLLNKGKRGVFKALFSRMGIILLLIVLQVLLLISIFRWLKSYSSILYIVGIVISAIIVFQLINKTMDPTSKLTWMFLISAFPLLGIVLYIFITHDLGNKFVTKRVNSIVKETKNYIDQDHGLLEEVKEEHPELYTLGNYIQNTSNYPIYRESNAKYFSTGEETFKYMIEELEKAEDFIFIEYFIITEGYMWGRILNILEDKIEQGVEVRVMYDGTCTFSNLPYNYPEKLKKIGIKCRMFSPLKPFISTHYNNRDHRKIMVIDGKVAFTGGINLSDEYINLVERYGHWKDNGIMIKGRAVKSFTLMFLQMWHHIDGEKEFEDYLKNSTATCDDGYIIPYGDIPTDHERVGQSVYMDIINGARKYLYIMSPYFIVDHEIVRALAFAGKKGVDVRILLPHIPDKKTIFAVAKTYYRDLIKAGVKIYEYTPGFVHSKVFLSDDKIGVVGSINLDYRSLYHHYENGVYLYRTQCLEDIKKDFMESFEISQKMTLKDVKNEPFMRKVIGKILKIFAPLL